MRRRAAGPVQPVTVESDEILEYLSDVMVFPAGHRLRSVRCLGCGTMIGGQPFIVHQTVAMNTEPCGCGGLGGTICLVCMRCKGLPGDTLVHLAVLRACTHHGGQA